MTTTLTFDIASARKILDVSYGSDGSEKILFILTPTDGCLEIANKYVVAPLSYECGRLQRLTPSLKVFPGGSDARYSCQLPEKGLFPKYVAAANFGEVSGGGYLECFMFVSDDVYRNLAQQLDAGAIPDSVLMHLDMAYVRNESDIKVDGGSAIWNVREGGAGVAAFDGVTFITNAVSNRGPLSRKRGWFRWLF